MENEIQPCYKVTTFYDNPRELCSFVARDKARVRYRLDEWSYPPEWLSSRGYGLCAFDSLDRAIEFRKEWNTNPGVHLIWFCWGMKPLPKLPMLFSSYLSEGYLVNSEGQWPEGTVFYERIKLVSRIICNNEWDNNYWFKLYK